MSLFKAHNIVKQYSNHIALDKVSITVPEQSIFGLLGPNGAGKTSLIRIINMITAPDSGELFISGEKLQPHHKEIIGYLPEERGLYKKMKVGEQAIYLARLKGLSTSEATLRLKEWFKKFEILPWWNRKVEELSKGMQQKVQFIITIIHNPKLIIFDEPFSGFDPINTNLVKDEILQLRQNGATIIFSTHNMESVEELCDNIALINKSKKILEGKVKEIKNTYKANTYYIELADLKGNLIDLLNQNYEIKEEWKDENLTKAKIKLINDCKPNELLSLIMPYSTIHGLSEILPTMNDIFIQRVSEDMLNK